MTASDQLRRADTIAAALSRGLHVDPISWEELLAIAQKELGKYQLRSYLDHADKLYEESEASGLIACARIVLEVANRPAVQDLFADVNYEAKNETEERYLLLVLAACSYGMYGNFVSAEAVRRLIDPSVRATEAQLLALAICSPRSLPKTLISRVVTDRGRDFLERLNYYLQTGDQLLGDQLVRVYEDFMRAPQQPSDIVFLRCARLALRHLIHLATSKLQHVSENKYFQTFVRNVIEDGRVALLPPQHNVIFNQSFLDASDNAIVTIPTSTGKTLLGEFSIAESLRAGGDVGIYVVPYIALGRQVLECFQRHAKNSFEVFGYFGNFKQEKVPLSKLRPNVIVATPERLDAILRSQNFYGSLRAIVFDEAHSIENGERGARLEGLITRIRIQQSLHEKIRIILLSAVLSEVEAVRRWLGVDAIHCKDSWRPTARRLALWTENHLSWFYGTDPLRPSGAAATSQLGWKQFSWPQYIRPTGHVGMMQTSKPAIYENVAFLARHLQSSLRGPVLIACGSKAGTRGVAVAISKSLSEIADPSRTRERLVDTISAKFPHLLSLARMIRRGVAYHNASLPPQIREAIEDAVRDRSLLYVAATTTLAEGVDLPFRSTIIVDWLLGFRDRQAPMSTLLFRNIAGRCGRAGEFTEGDTVIFDNVLGDTRYTGDSRRRSYQAQLFGDPPPLQSTLTNDNLAPETKLGVQAVLASQLLASIPENPDEDFLDQVWARSSYAAHYAPPPLVAFKTIRSELLDADAGEPFAVAASPMKLTPFGAAANRSGFSPRTCRDIVGYLRTLSGFGDDAEIAAQALLRFGNCSEQSNYLLRDIADGKKTTFYVKQDDLESLAKQWLLGMPLLGMFTQLSRAQKSKAAISPSQWALGKDYEPVAAQWDKFAELTEYAFSNFLPWLFRAFAALSNYGAMLATSTDWIGIAERFETAREVDVEGIDETMNSAIFE